MFHTGSSILLIVGIGSRMFQRRCWAMILHSLHSAVTGTTGPMEHTFVGAVRQVQDNRDARPNVLCLCLSLSLFAFASVDSHTTTVDVSCLFLVLPLEFCGGLICPKIILLFTDTKV